MITIFNTKSIVIQNNESMCHCLGWGGCSFVMWNGWLSKTEKGHLPIGPTVLCVWEK